MPVLWDVVLLILSSIVALTAHDDLSCASIAFVERCFLPETAVSKFLLQMVLEERRADEIELSHAATERASDL